MQGVYGVDIPDWLGNFCFDFGGIIVKNITKTQLIEKSEQDKIPNLILHENFFLENSELVLKLLDNDKIKNFILFNLHPFLFDKNSSKKLLETLDTLAKNKNIFIIVVGLYEKKFNNIKICNVELQEHQLSHHFVLLLANILKDKRNPTVTFTLQSIYKDPYRKTIGNYILESTIKNDLITPPQTDSETLGKKRDNFLKTISEQYPDGQHIQALKSFGSGLPNFTVYERAFCELVLETSNNGSWHFSEKTIRPLALGIPIVHLGHKSIYDHLTKIGYRLYDYDNFYEKWHTGVSLEKKLPDLLNFLIHIQTNIMARTKMEQIAEHNFKIFWNERKNYFYRNIHNFFNNIVGDTTFTHSIYKKLNF